MVLNKIFQVYDRVLNMTRVLNMPVLHVENATSYIKTFEYSSGSPMLGLEYTRFAKMPRLQRVLCELYFKIQGILNVLSSE